MVYLLITIAVATIILFVLWLHARKQAATHGTTTVKELAGICRTATVNTTRKNRNKVKIIGLLEERQELSNSEIREFLGVSSRSVVNYTSELEKEGRITQVGDIGRGVIYRLK